MNPWEQLAPELVTDLYELTMAASYLEEKMFGEATFSLFIRNYPPHRNYFVSAGIEHLLEIIPRLRFSDESIEYLASLNKFSSAFLDYLRGFRFTGNIRAIPEGRIFFTQEPILEVSGPIIEAQILETLIINVVQLETLIATKAARCVEAARGRSLIDFSLRRTQGVDAGLKVARASYLAGFAGTSNVLAGKVYGIPVFGTMAHSYITSFEHEIDSFLAFAETFPDNVVFLIDTYDTIRGAKRAIEAARRLKAEGKSLQAVRLDSGDLVELSRDVRKLLQDAGFPEVKILASGSLDEYKLQDLLDSGAEIDIFAVGTRMGVSSDAPYLDIAYKLVEYDGRPTLKLSSGKKTWVGRKQVYRYYDDEGRMKYDTLALLAEEHPDGAPLMGTVLEKGERLRPEECLESIRARFRKEFEMLPQRYRGIEAAERYPVNVSKPLLDLEERTAEEIARQELG